MAKKLSGLSRMIKASDPTSPAAIFLKDLEKAIQDLDEVREPSKTFKPSSIGGCERQIYYILTGAQQDDTTASPSLIGICDTGTFRHDSIQTVITQMKELGHEWEWVDVEEYVKEFKPPGTSVIEKQGLETKCFNDIYNLSFLCDGILKYRGKYYFLEIKTETRNKFQTRQAPEPAHIMQTGCYSLAFGIEDVIFLYENRDICTKKSFFYKVTDEDRQKVLDKMEYCNKFLADGTPPPKPASAKCDYCKYRKKCKEDEAKCQEIPVKTGKPTSITRSKATKDIGF